MFFVVCWIFWHIFHCMTFRVVNQCSVLSAFCFGLTKDCKRYFISVSTFIYYKSSCIFTLFIWIVCAEMCLYDIRKIKRYEMGAFPSFNSGCITHSERNTIQTVWNIHNIFINNSNISVCLLFLSRCNLHFMYVFVRVWVEHSLNAMNSVPCHDAYMQNPLTISNAVCCCHQVDA